MVKHVPNLLTLSRILFIPLFVGTFYLDSPLGSWLGLAIFTAASITDFFDGWLARKLNVISALGRFLDPIADKLLVATALLTMTAFGHIDQLSLLPAVVILCREVLVSGLREYLAEIRVALPVSMLAKWKTAVQMVAISVLIVGDAGPAEWHLKLIGDVLLWIAGVLTLQTGYIYLRTGLRHMTAEEK